MARSGAGSTPLPRLSPLETLKKVAGRGPLCGIELAADAYAIYHSGSRRGPLGVEVRGRVHLAPTAKSTRNANGRNYGDANMRYRPSSPWLCDILHWFPARPYTY